MTLQEIVEKIYTFDGNAKEWLRFESEIEKEIVKLSETEVEVLAKTEAMEHLLMICDGIRFELQATHSKE